MRRYRADQGCARPDLRECRSPIDAADADEREGAFDRT
jgi:hypothetical protein